MVAPKKQIMGKGESVVGGVARGAARGGISRGSSSKTNINKTVSAIKTAVKTSSERKANARALKAANKPTRASKNPEVQFAKKLTKTNKQMNQDDASAARNAARTVDVVSKAKKEKGLKWNKKDWRK